MSRRELVVDPVSNEKEDTEPTIMADRRTSDSMDMVDDSVDGTDMTRVSFVRACADLVCTDEAPVSSFVRLSCRGGRGASRAAIIHERNCTEATQMTDMPAQTRSSISARGGGVALAAPSSSSLPYMSSSHFSPTLTPQQYLQRMFDLSQMDLQSAIDQMRTLLSLYPQRVYKMAYYRKQTKNHWARDDPAFCFVQVIMVMAFSVAYGFAFRVGSISAMFSWVAKSLLLHWLGFGIIVASVGRVVANQHLMSAQLSPSHVRQDVEWLYAFDVHCNAFVPLFVLLCKCLIHCNFITWGDIH